MGRMPDALRREGMADCRWCRCGYPVYFDELADQWYHVYASGSDVEAKQPCETRNA